MSESFKINAIVIIFQSTYIFFIIFFDLLYNSKKKDFLNQSSNLNFRYVHEKVIKKYRQIINIILRNVQHKYNNYLLTSEMKHFCFIKLRYFIHTDARCLLVLAIL